MYTYIAYSPTTTNSDLVYFDIFKQFVEVIVSYFPPSFFKSISIDNKSHRKNFYNINSDGRITAVLNSHELKIAKKSKPYLNISFKRNINNIKDVWGGLSQSRVYSSPIAYNQFDRNRGMYTKIMEDKQKKILLHTNESYEDISFDINIVVSSMADQESVSNILYSDVVSEGFSTMDCNNIEIMIPNFLYTIMREVLFKQEIMDLSLNKSLTKEETDNISDMINERMFEYLNEKSNGSINKYDDFSKTAGNNDLMFAVKRDQKAFYSLSRFVTGDGEKEGNVYTSFTLSSSGNIQTFSPTNFVFEFPDYVNGIFIDDKIKRANFYNNILLHDFKKINRFRRERFDDHMTDYTGFEMFLDEIDLTFDKDDDINDKSINIRSILMNKICKDPRERKIYLAFLEVYENSSLDIKKQSIIIDTYKDYDLIVRTGENADNGCEIEYETLSVNIKDDIDYDALYSVRLQILSEYYTDKIQKKITTV